MRKIMNRVLSLLLSVLLLFTMLPHGAVTALDLGLQTLRPVGGMELAISSAMDGCKMEVVRTWEGNSGDFTSQSEVDFSQYGSFDDAVAATREQMADRSSTIIVYIVSSEANVDNLIQSYKDQVLAHTGDARYGDSIRWQFSSWEIGLSYGSDGSGNYYYAVTNTVAYYTTAEEEAAVDTAVAELLQTLDVAEQSDYAKVKAVYDWLCANVDYDYDNLENADYTRKFSAYAALIDRTSVCQGYAVLFYRLMLELGVDARLIAGVGNGGAHSWNIVELDELYYNLDATWDAGLTEYSYFLRADANFGDHTRNTDYSGASFYALYPMSATDYDPSALPEGDCAHGSCEYFDGYEATCTADGMQAYWYCSLCDTYFADETLTESVTQEELVIPASGHNYDGTNTWNSVEPTCTRGGVLEIEVYCTACNTGLSGNARPIEALGHDYVDGVCTRCGEEKTLTGACGDNLTWSYNEYSYTLTIEGSGAMYAYPYYNVNEGADYAPWFTYAKQITTVVIGENVESIGTDAFYGCESMTDVYVLSEDVAAGLTGTNACGGLLKYAQRVYIWVALSVADYVSSNFPNRSAAELNGYNMYCYSIEQIENTCEHLGLQDFVEEPTCTEQGYTGVWCPECLYHYEYDFVPALGHDYVDGICTVCGEEYQPSGVCGEDLTWSFDAETGTLTISGTGEMWDYGPYGNGEEAPWTVIRDQIQSLVFDDTVTYIGHYAFCGCTALTQLNFPVGVSGVGIYAFGECTGLTELVIGADCAWEIVFTYAFADCTNLTDVYIFSEERVGASAHWFSYAGILDHAQRVYICQADEVSDAIDVTFSCDNVPEDVEIDGVACLLYTRGTHNDIITYQCNATCTEYGGIEYTCTSCGYIHAEFMEEPFGHDWDESYVCANCGAAPDYFYEEVITLEDLILGEDGCYYTADGCPAVIAVDAPLAWLGENSLLDCVDIYGEECFSLTYWEQLLAVTEEDGFAPLTSETLAWLLDVITGNPAWGEDESFLTHYIAYRIIRNDTPEIAEHTHIWAENGTCEICCEVKTDYNTEQEVVVEELVVSDNSQYTTEAGDTVYIDMNQLAAEYGVSTYGVLGRIRASRLTGLQTMQTGEDYWALLVAQMNADGYTPLTEETMAWLQAFLTEQNAEDEAPVAAGEYLVTKPVTTYEHSYNVVVIEPTCTAIGYTIHTCTCGHSYTTDVMPATGHADTEKAGEKDHLCDTCGKKLSHCTDRDLDGLCDWCGAEMEPAYVSGDLDGNGEVNSDDAIYLLYSTFKPEEYPCNQNCDMDGDGDVDSDDAIYLLYHTFKPDDYPLP